MSCFSVLHITMKKLLMLHIIDYIDTTSLSTATINKSSSVSLKQGSAIILITRVIFFISLLLRAAYKIKINVIENTILTYNTNIFMA